MVGLDRNHAVHVEMPTRLEHEQPAKMIEMLARVAPLGEEGRSRNRRIARHDDADRLPAGVHLDGFEAYLPRRRRGHDLTRSPLIAVIRPGDDISPPTRAPACRLDQEEPGW